MGRPVSESAVYAESLGITERQLNNLGGCAYLKSLGEEARAVLLALALRRKVTA